MGHTPAGKMTHSHAPHAAVLPYHILLLHSGALGQEPVQQGRGDIHILIVPLEVGQLGHDTRHPPPMDRIKWSACG